MVPGREGTCLLRGGRRSNPQAHGSGSCFRKEQSSEDLACCKAPRCHTEVGLAVRRSGRGRKDVQQKHSTRNQFNWRMGLGGASCPSEQAFEDGSYKQESVSQREEGSGRADTGRAAGWLKMHTRRSSLNPAGSNSGA